MGAGSRRIADLAPVGWIGGASMMRGLGGWRLRISAFVRAVTG
jgi:hypothetical protein